MRDYWHNRSLIKQLVAREIYGRYQGTHLGFLWVVLEPLLMLAVYTFVFRVIFSRHWHPEGESTLEFSIILFSGLLVFNLFRETINNAPRLVLRNANYVKKVVFPLEVLPLVSVLSGFYHLCVSFIVLIISCLLNNGSLHVEILYIPFILLPYILIIYGASLFLASVGVYLRDIAQIIGMMVMATLFLSAIFYPIESVPEQYRIWFYLNPVAFTVDQFRGAVIWGRTPQWQWMLLYYPVSIIISWLGIFWFQRTRKGFADVL
ncbi:MAG: ABC transporter permease [Candidatus Polarisedimenticolaceae bacterium]|nr:ABC transporter permease [Candidatus Polarisedimenticolaceae bacterium]